MIITEEQSGAIDTPQIVNPGLPSDESSFARIHLATTMNDSAQAHRLQGSVP